MLSAAGKSPKTISSYLDSAKRLEAYLTIEGLPLEPEGILAFLVAERERTTPTSAVKHYRNLRVYLHWLLTEGEIKEDPMVRVEKPHVAEEARPFFADAELAALLKVTRGQDLEARRDHAIIRVLIDTGIRVSGLANLRYLTKVFVTASGRYWAQPGGVMWFWLTRPLSRTR